MERVASFSFISGIVILIFILFTSMETKGGAGMFVLKSPAFKEGEVIPREHTCEGSDTSPELSWEGAPAGVRSYALIVEDPDAPVGTFIHWVIYDIPGNFSALPGALPKKDHLSDGIKQGITDFRRIGYWGPCPPRGHGRHRYYFKLRALDIPSLNLPPGATKADVERAMQGHILGEATLMGVYSR